MEDDMLSEPWYVLRYSNGEYVGIDPGSGYPYRAGTPSQIQWFPTEVLAERYRKAFPGLTLFKITAIQLSRVEVDNNDYRIP
jgi:hypothetical protein